MYCLVRHENGENVERCVGDNERGCVEMVAHSSPSQIHRNDEGLCEKITLISVVNSGSVRRSLFILSSSI